MDHTDKIGNNKNEERRKRVFVGKLPPDFLKIDNIESETAQEQEVEDDNQTAFTFVEYKSEFEEGKPILGRLKVNIAQAKLVKNYGITRMDPYVTMRIGQFVYETQVDMNGGKNPKWNRVIQCRIPTGVRTINVKIYDECSLKVDELIAWAEIVIPPSVFKGETCDDWFPLSGRQGERVEGMINLMMKFSPGNGPYEMYPRNSFVVSLPVENKKRSSRNFLPSPVFPSSPIRERSQPPFAGDLKLVEEMFPNMDKEVVKSVFESSGGNKDMTVHSLLQMSG